MQSSFMTQLGQRCWTRYFGLPKNDFGSAVVSCREADIETLVVFGTLCARSCNDGRWLCCCYWIARQREIHFFERIFVELRRSPAIRCLSVFLFCWAPRRYGVSSIEAEALRVNLIPNCTFYSPIFWIVASIIANETSLMCFANWSEARSSRKETRDPVRRTRSRRARF